MTTDEVATIRGMVADRFNRIDEAVRGMTDGLTDAVAFWRPDPDANSISWLVWHLTRIEDDHVAFLTGAEQVWTSGGFFERFALPFDAAAHGYGHTSADVAKVRVAAPNLAEYHAAVHVASLEFAASLTAENLRRVVDTRWDPPVTAAVRLVSLTGDCLAHLGQAQYVRGMAERAHVQ